jgi:acyl-CoA reductase-like NAD-dependent aldehyde dehydrogenase
LKISNPFNKEILKELQEDTKRTLIEKHSLLLKGHEVWSETPIANRVKVISKYAELLKENHQELGKTLSLETGKPINEATGEVLGAVKKLKFFIEDAAQYLEPKSQNQDGDVEEILGFDSLGVVCNISAWNYPYLIGINTYIPALLCGNSVFYKPSEFSTLTGIHMAELLIKAGLPENVFQLAIGGKEVGAELLQMDLKGYYFTGSYPTGKYIAEQIAGKMVPMTLELGGKDPAYVLDDVASIKDSAESVMWGAFYNSGQSCCSVERIYVHEKIYDEFVSCFVECTKQLVMGDPADKNTQMGALTRSSHIVFLENLLKDAVAKGAKIECGGERTDSNFLPTVLTNVTHEMDCMVEETFGPIIGIQKVSNDEEALALMNDTKFGLTASVFSSNEERAKKLMNKLHAGNVYFNCSDRVSGYLPWNGRGQSGNGSSLSYLGLYPYCNPKGFHFNRG